MFVCVWGGGGGDIMMECYSYCSCSKQHKSNSDGQLHPFIALLEFYSWHVRINHEWFLFYASTAHSGESYAGIYVPTLVNTIRIMNERATSDQQINLKGFMVCQLIN